MESLVSLKCEAALPSGDPLNKDKDGESVTSSSAPAPHRPVKKQTRQWAAWTRQEEESFFNALRQVGKNFEMITCRVQSKNKDQVRHYYYRLVRRMNKLLGPDFSLDAKNSKDTNAAMLRWWSLLEKYRCRASKLHLKPRRFKIFIEALEHQLLKDRKKNIRKRPPQNENCSSSSTATLASQSKSSGHDSRSVKLILVDSQNIQKVAPGKGSLLKRSVNNGTNSSNNKGDLSTAKTRQRRKTGATSSAAYKRWEKAAIAGVSLVADAAEHLERTTIDKNVVPDQGTLDESIPSTSVPTKPADGNSVIDTLGKISAELTLSTTSQQVAETSVQPSLKLKLQLFPIDEATRTALEKEEHNPHLELTLRDRKKITSVLEHLNRKWGKSSIASGELILVPYSAQRDKISGCQKWTQEAVASAADVYASIGSPQVFRLRYGWFSSAELVSIISGSPLARRYPQEEGMGLDNWNKKGHNLDLPAAVPVKPSSHDSEHLLESFRDQPTSMIQDPDLLPSFTDFPEAMTGYGGAGPENNILKSTESSANSWLRKQSGDGIIRRHWEHMDNIKTSGAPLSAGDWADSLTNISIGELLTEAAQMDTDGSETPVNGSAHNSTHFIQQIPFSCDSFDAAIAAHIAGHQDRLDLPSAQVSHGPSIWDAEETCDAFSFRKIALPKQEDAPSSRTTTLETGKQIASTTSMCFRDFVEELPETRTTQNIFCGEVSTANNCVSNAYKPDNTKDFSGLTDTYWPDSLGPLDLDVPTLKYQGQDLILGDSISLTGLNRLIANSLDAFQNCSFFGLDKVTPAADGRESAPLLERKIGGEV